MNLPTHHLLSSFSDLGAVDTHCYLGQWPYRLGAQAESTHLLAYTAKYKLDAVWVAHLGALFGFDTRTANEACLAGCTGKLRPFAILNPREDSWQEELSWVAESGFLGVQLAPGFHRYELNEAIDVVETCRDHGLLVKILVRLDDARVRHPLSPAIDVTAANIVDLIRALSPSSRSRGPAPKTREPLLVSGMNWAEWQELSRHFALSPPPDLLLDTWHINGPTGIANEFGSDRTRWVFGSGFPVQTPESSMVQLVAASLPGGALASIARTNAENIQTRRTIRT